MNAILRLCAALCRVAARLESWAHRRAQRDAILTYHAAATHLELRGHAPDVVRSLRIEARRETARLVAQARKESSHA